MRQSGAATQLTSPAQAPVTGAASFLTVGGFRLKQAAQPLTDAWRHVPVESRHSTLLGISFRPPQVAALRLDARATLQTLLTYPFQLIRLGAYWSHMEPQPGTFYPDELDWQIDAAERAGVLLTQWWQMRDQGDSLAAAQRMADIVGIDYYPRHALMSIGGKTLYLDGSASLWQETRRKRVCAWTRAHGQKLMISEGQAEPWE